MSLRAIKKRESQLTPAIGGRPTIFKKSSSSLLQQRKHSGVAAKHADIFGSSPSKAAPVIKDVTYGNRHTLKQQRVLLGRSTSSNPELHRYSDSLEQLVATHAHARLVRTKSEGDVITVLQKGISTNSESATGGLLSAKSEVCLQTISSHNYQIAATPVSIKQPSPVQATMITRSHRDLSQTAYNTNAYDTTDVNLSPTSRRMSECSLNTSAGGYSQRTSTMSSSASTLLSNLAVDINAVVRVPIIGYEVMEERARFTVFKLRIENPLTNDCWLVLRRYTDFVRLNTKLKQSFPHITLVLPRKKIFGDNFNSVFLDNRVQGLQMFVNSVMAKEELRKFKIVRDFFCLDEPPTYSESMEECRAIFEAQEETIAHLKLQISNKNDLILNLQRSLRDEINEKEQLKETFKNLTHSCSRCSTENGAALLK